MNLEVLPEEVTDGHLAFQSQSVVLTCRRETGLSERQNLLFCDKTPLRKACGEEENNQSSKLRMDFGRVELQASPFVRRCIKKPVCVLKMNPSLATQRLNLWWWDVKLVHLKETDREGSGRTNAAVYFYRERDVQKVAHGYATNWLNAELKNKGKTQPAALTGLHSDSNINLQKLGGKRKKSQKRKRNSSFGLFFLTDP